jgi:ABC-type Mn2+/Zn2+ transport system ATPase subunit
VTERPVSAAAPLLAAAGLRARVGGRVLFEDLSLEVRAGVLVVLTGPNGTGKSSLLRILLGLARPDAGQVTRAEGLAIGYVPQLDPSDSGIPFPAVTVVGQGIPWPGRPASGVLCREALARVGYRSPPRRRYDVLSGGERRRVLLARALVRRPHLLALDEPTAGVDAEGERDVLRIVLSEVRERGAAALWVCHGLRAVESEADHVLRLGGTP